MLGLIGIEPITFRYERNILPLNYRKFKNARNFLYSLKPQSVKRKIISTFKQACYQTILKT